MQFYANRLDFVKLEAGNNEEEPARVKIISQPAVDKVHKKRSKFLLFGPKLELMRLSRGSGGIMSSSGCAEMHLTAYDRYHKGYMNVLAHNDIKDQEPDHYNDELKAEYDLDPRIFWTNAEHMSAMDDQLVSFAIYIFSIFSGSAGPEREFSRMGYLLSARRSRYTASNSDKRLTLANLIPQKRRLERVMAERKLKRAKLFK